MRHSANLPPLLPPPPSALPSVLHAHPEFEGGEGVVEFGIDSNTNTSGCLDVGRGREVMQLPFSRKTLRLEGVCNVLISRTDMLNILRLKVDNR